MSLPKCWNSLKDSTKTLIRGLQIIDSYDVRRYLAIAFAAGGSIACTTLLGWVIFLLSTNAAYLFWIAIGLLLLIAVQQSGFLSLLIKRSILVSKDKVEIIDRDAKIL